MFVIAGDQNSDPFDGDSVPGSIQQLLDHPLVNTKVTPDSLGDRAMSSYRGVKGNHETYYRGVTLRTPRAAWRADFTFALSGKKNGLRRT